MIDAKAVRDLRQETGVGIMDAKKALMECDGCLGCARHYLREVGQAVVRKNGWTPTRCWKHAEK